MIRRDYLIVGAGVGGASVCEGIREHDKKGTVMLVGAEASHPYHRPQLLKSQFGKTPQPVENIQVHEDDWSAKNHIHLRLVFTTGSFGSAPGSGGRGGWPWASLPGRVMFEGLNVQQAHDWNQAHASKPLHNVALLDRLESYAPDRKTWALLDNFQLLFGREAYQRACALALTRGIQGIGTNFLPGPGDAAQPEVAAFEKEMALWMRKYGGVYAATKPVATIGIFFSHH